MKSLKKNLLRLLVIFSSILILQSCKQIEYVNVPINTVDTVFINNTSTDTLIIKDSVIIREKGDSVILEKVKETYKNRLVYDTITKIEYKEKPVEVIKTVEVPKQMTIFEKTMFIIGMISSAFGVLILINKIKD